MYGSFCGRLNRVGLRGLGNFACAGTHGGGLLTAAFLHNQSRGGVTTNPETDLWLDQPIQPPVPGTKLLVKTEGGDPDPHASQEFAPPALLLWARLLRRAPAENSLLSTCSSGM